jgi:hypothetical protein
MPPTTDATSSRESPGRRRGGRRPLILGGALVLGVVFGLGLLSRGGQSAPVAASTGSAATGPTQLAPLTGQTSGGVVDGIGAGNTEQLAFHIHAHLAIYVNGRQETIPYGIGVLPPMQLQQTVEGPFVVGGTAFYWLHTHDDSGVIHIESPVVRQYTLGEFFDIWGQPLGPTQVGPVRGPVTIRVDGRTVTGDPRDVPLDEHSVIQLDVGSVGPLQPFTFPAGL